MFSSKKGFANVFSFVGNEVLKADELASTHF